jgi:hypothetical protein
MPQHSLEPEQCVEVPGGLLQHDAECLGGGAVITATFVIECRTNIDFLRAEME